MTPGLARVTNSSGGGSGNNNVSSGNDENAKKKTAYWKFWAFVVVLVLDGIASILLFTPMIPAVSRLEGEETDHYTLYFSTIDLAGLSAARLLVCAAGLVCSYLSAKVPPEYPFELTHPNGDKKTREELDQEALEEAFCSWFRRFVSRSAFLGELLGLSTQIFCVVKSLARMNVEIGAFGDSHPTHPVFWLAVLLAAVLSCLESCYLESVCNVAARCGEDHLNGGVEAGPGGLLRRVGSALSVPLLGQQQEGDEDAVDENDEERPVDPADVRGESDITGDANYKAGWSDLLMTCYPDLHLIALASVFLLLAAVAQVYIPRYLGNILDALTKAFADNDKNDHHNDSDRNHESIVEVPGFMMNVKLLVLASIAAGVFAGIRGALFTVVGGRVNVRLRVQLMDALLSQDIAFFDVTKTGDITSRLSSDTTLVGDQVAYNVNIFLRCLAKAAGVLLFMFLISWQLSLLAFISVPAITVLSRWYGNYFRALTKLMQKKLADGNSVSEAALGSMSTVRSFDAAESELADFESYMRKYLLLNIRSGIAYCGFAAMTVALPQLVFAVVVFYGGLLVRSGDMTSGQLVSFLLYLQSLSDAFNGMGWVFSALTQAVGAADKVFELMHRKPRIRSPTRNEAPEGGVYSGILGVEATKTRKQRTFGLCPERAEGAIELDDVQLYYPSRPQRRVLDGLSMKVEPGSVVALVGKSGGGKSSVMSLIQHLYEPSGGRILLDGMQVHDLSPAWLSRNISIVSQEPTLFARSIKKNIMYGLEGTDKEPTQEEIEEAARLANADDFIQKMPQKYDTEVGERGVQLSGGQKQRVAIARALVRRPRVLLLDEATSALDAESEHLVQQAIDDMIARGKSGKGGAGAMTVIIVAHRLSTVRNADCIFVVQEGRVVERGSHDELIQQPEGAYTLLINRQMDAQRKLENGNADITK